MLRVNSILLIIAIVVKTQSTDYAVPFDYDSCRLNKPQQDSKVPPIILDRLDLKVSRRVTHQIVTRIFAIFLKEIYRFDNIFIDDVIDHLNFDNIPENVAMYTPLMELVNMRDDAEKPAVDLEVLVPPDSHVAYPPGVIQGSSLSSDLMRYGLYILKTIGTKLYSYEDFVKDSLRYRENIKDFVIQSDEIKQSVTPYLDISGNSKGSYVPHQCGSSSEPCAVVFTSFYNDTRFFIDHINKFKLKLKVYFLGDRLAKVIKNFNDHNEKIIKTSLNQPLLRFLVLHWTPSEIIDNPSLSFETVEMPKCELYESSTTTCRYEIIPALTFLNVQAKESPGLFDLMNTVQFKSLKPMIQIYQDFAPRIEKIILSRKFNIFDGQLNENETLEMVYNEIACKWLRENENVYSIDKPGSWIRPIDTVFEVSIGGIFPKDNSGIEYNGIKIATEMALQRASNELANTGYKLLIKNYQCECKPDVVLKTFINLYAMRKHLIGVLGPACSEAIEPIAGISKHFKMSVISYSAEGISFDDREQFPHFYRTIGETKQYEDVYMKLLTKLDWKRFAALTEDGHRYTQYISDMEPMMKEKGIDLIVNRKFTRSKDRQLEKFKTYLKELKSNPNRAKIIISDVHDPVLMKSILCAASKLSMTAASGYVWFLPVYVSMKMNNTGLKDIDGECTESDIRNAMNGHFALSYASFGNDLDIIDGGNETVAQWKEEYLTKMNKNKTQFADYAAFTFDAIWVYVKALKQLIKEDNLNPSNNFMHSLSSEKTMAKLATILNEMNFQGASGQIQFNGGGSRYTDVNILQWQENDFRLVGTYIPKIQNRTIVDGDLNLNSRIKWLSGDKPSDGRESCTLKGVAETFGTDCHTLRTFLIVVLCFLIISACSASSFFFWKRKYDMKKCELEESAQIMANYGMVVNGIELIKWEIPRENVVINRKLGEGAFGTVYGGEAKINGSDTWEAVAIKTLKAGSNAENRLDFLAESETMKKFENKNIVKLFAVCLQAEPLYTIMEYMLYGDLKTFLLARRHLVNDRLSDDSDVSPKRLTLMALDVARALSYLASKNYVHRDIACRNCMINAQRVVKLGDFGMARPTFDCDYYRFARKGMLPIRWMSPESIDGGIFSHASDIWSYGVLLYEIVTLGAFPFQGLNNNQVFENVKSGNHIKIPATCKPHLKALMQSCFSLEKERRPGATTIVEFISNSPRMLTPCMDVPKPNLDDQVNSLNLIDSDTDQLEIFEQQIMDNRDRSHTSATTVDFLRTSVSSSALQNNLNHVIHHKDPSFDYLDMKLPKKPNGIYLHDFHPDLTATLPNGNYNPVEPLLRGTRTEISKSNLSLMKYVPMCAGFGKNNNRSPSSGECTSAL